MKDLQVLNNTSSWGGGIFSFESSPNITGTLLQGNRAERKDDIGGEGGGVYVFKGTPGFTGCQISDNAASWGGGILCSNSRIKIENSTIKLNRASERTFSTNVILGNWDTIGLGGGLCSENSEPLIIDCQFIGNKSVWGGGLYCFETNASITDS